MTIGLDATYSVGTNLTGVGVYSREILSGLLRAHPGPRYLFCYRPHRLLRGLKEGGRSRLLWRDWPSNIDLFHALNQRLDAGRFRRAVTTFHDLFVITGEYSSPEFRARFERQARVAAERSDLIIAVSQYTADQIEEVLKIAPSRIRVIHHGVHPPKPAPEAAQRTNRILFVGAIQKRKNVLRLIQAFERTPDDWKLTLAGSLGYGTEEILQAVHDSPRLRDIEVTGYVRADRLDQLYRTAAIFAFPSLDEGFGMPVLEAMAHGVPVLTSNRSSLREVSGNAALLVDPADVNSIAAGLNKLIDDAQLRQSLRAKGLKHVTNFTWEAAVEKTWQVYKELSG